MVVSHIDPNGHTAHLRNDAFKSASTLLITCRILVRRFQCYTCLQIVRETCTSKTLHGKVDNVTSVKFMKHVKTCAPNKTIPKNVVKSTMKLVTLQNALIITPSRMRLKLLSRRDARRSNINWAPSRYS